MLALDRLKESALCELGNIGAGMAATALSQLVGRGIRIDVPKVHVMSPGAFLAAFGRETRVIGTHIKILGDVTGGMLFVLTNENASKLVNLIMGLGDNDGGHQGALGPMEQSALKETGLILSASYLNALGQAMDARFIPSVPRILSGLCTEVLAQSFEESLKEASGIIGIESVFSESSSGADACFFFLPEAKGLSALFKCLETWVGGPHGSSGKKGDHNGLHRPVGVGEA